MGRLYCAWVGSLMFLAGFVGAAEKSANYQWTEAQMNPREKSTGGNQLRKIPSVSLLLDDQSIPKQVDCHKEKCKFDLFYFRGDGFTLADPKRKNILFIAGGPGQVVNNQRQENRMLGYLEAKHNVIYFDLRGGGRSLIPGDNKYDSFLRAPPRRSK